MIPSVTTTLKIQVFGAPSISLCGKPIARTRTRKGEWLLAILLLRHAKSVERSWLAGTLWPDSDERKALFNLRHCLNDLRHKLGDSAPCIYSPTKHTLMLTLPDSAWCDVVTFDEAIEHVDTASIQRAVDVYRGPLLQGCLEAWCIQEREAREQLYLDALDRLAEVALAAEDWVQALKLMRTSVSVNPLRETSQQKLLVSLAGSGDSTGMLDAYRNFRLLIWRELCLEPSAETEQLYLKLRKAAYSGERTVLRLSAAASTDNAYVLPRPRAAFIGRHAELREVSNLLRSRRMVSLIGTGGVGKTRLAIETAEAVFRDPFTNAWFVDLAVLSEPSQVDSAIGLALHCKQSPTESLSGRITSFLRDKRSLLILDNCEHLAAECALAADSLLQACPKLTILATSREPLRIPDECLHRVPSLSIPDYSVLQSPAHEVPGETMKFDSVRLFVQRAALQQPGFVLSANNLGAVVRICRNVDGIPLAIELAAARMHSITVEQIAGHLDETFDLLAGGMRTALPRHQTLKALIEWSFALLSAREGLMLWRLTVFAGAWSLEDAEGVCSGDGINRHNIVDLISSLVDKSLIDFDPNAPGSAYRLLETTRSCARAYFSGHGGETATKDNHAAHYSRLVKEWDACAVGPDHAARLDLPERAYDNVRAAMVWLTEACAGTNDERDLELAAALVEFWYYRAHITEGQSWLERCLGAHSARTNARARALLGLSRLISCWKDLERVTQLIEEALNIYQETHDLPGMASAFSMLGLAMDSANDQERSLSAFERALSLFTQCGNVVGEIDALKLIGLHHINHRNWQAAQVLLEKGLMLARTLEDPILCAGPLNNLGLVAYSQRDYARAFKYHEECLRLNRLTENRSGIAWSLSNLGETALAMNDIEKATNFHCDSLSGFVAIDHHDGISEAVRGLVMVAGARIANREQSLTAARLLGAWEAVSAELGTAVPPYNVDEHDGVVARLRAVLGTEDFDRVRNDGRILSVKHAIEFALSMRVAVSG